MSSCIFQRIRKHFILSDHQGNFRYKQGVQIRFNFQAPLGKTQTIVKGSLQNK